MTFEEFDNLYQQHHMFVRRVALRDAREPLDAEDITQEVWCNVWERGGPLEDIENCEAWLATITHNAAKDYYRTVRPDLHGMTGVPPGAGLEFVSWEDLEDAEFEGLSAEEALVEALYK